MLALEPEVDALAGVYSESTGIIDSHAYMLSLVGELEAAGGMIAFLTEVTALRRWSGGVRVCCDDFALDADLVVNAAGLNAPAMASRLGGHHRGYYAKGHYYTLSGKSPFSRLVYPVAEAGGLGVHVTLDLAGQARFGPDVVWQEDEDYAFDESRLDRFVAAIRRYYPRLDESRLHPGYTGIRPKLAPAGSAAPDFVIEGPAETSRARLRQPARHRVPGAHRVSRNRRTSAGNRPRAALTARWGMRVEYAPSRNLAAEERRLALHAAKKPTAR